jgi:hypothetical protein
MYTLAGFEPGSTVPEADAMFNTPRPQGKTKAEFLLRFVLKIPNYPDRIKG